MPGRMILEKVRSEGLSHLSYLVGHKGEAVVIDPRRDVQVYLDLARQHGLRILHVFETHRNEDYVIGSQEIARRTGATVHHGAALDFEYGSPVREGDSFEIGDLRIDVLETPGHTYESISLVLTDTATGDEPVGVFTGDALFVGDVGRTDFFPDRREEVAGLLYDSIHDKLLPLGDQTLLFPAHGAGSVCGSGMAPREFSTLGLERLNNPQLQKGREEFIRFKAEEHHYIPPYFRRMEQYNLTGDAPEMPVLPTVPAMDADALQRARDDGAFIVDTRDIEAYGGAHVPGSYCLPLAMIPAFAGWILDYDTPIVLIVSGAVDVDTAVRHLIRLGYDNVVSHVEGIEDWETSGRPFGRVRGVHAEEVKRRIDSGEAFTLLDVRSIEEFESGHVEDATHMYVGELPGRLEDVPRDRPITTFCGSGERAMVAAGILKANGFEDVENNLGSMQACMSVGCRMVEPAAT